MVLSRPWSWSRWWMGGGQAVPYGRISDRLSINSLFSLSKYLSTTSITYPNYSLLRKHGVKKPFSFKLYFVAGSCFSPRPSLPFSHLDARRSMTDDNACDSMVDTPLSSMVVANRSSSITILAIHPSLSSMVSLPTARYLAGAGWLSLPNTNNCKSTSTIDDDMPCVGSG